ncbi:MAG TPA: DUF5675 family protein [Vicinamibacterales bacterium]|nr:DUF5675 family protein [Vicinamibacterales bacterium]
MNLRLIREPSRHLATFGVLFVDDIFFGFTLEDQLRERADRPVAEWKVYGETAIKAGRYQVKLTPSQRFGRVLPELLHVEGFTGIRIHAGNKRQDSLGCILVGRMRDDDNRSILQSQVAMAALMSRLVDAKGPIWISIENPSGFMSVNEA